MTSTPALDRISDQQPAQAGFDANGDPIDDFAGGAASWPTVGQGSEPTENGQQVGRGTQGGHGQRVDRATDSGHGQQVDRATQGRATQAPAADGSDSAGGEEPVVAELVEPQADDAQGEFPEHLLADAGLTAEQARQQFGTPEALEAALDFHLQKVINAGRQRTQAQPQPTQLPAGLQGLTPPQLPSQQVPSPLPGDQVALPVKGWYKPFAEVAKAMKDPDGDPIYADETIRLIEAMDAHNAAQFDSLAGALGPMLMRTHQGFQQFAAERAAQAVEQHYQTMERRFAELGDGWADTFGKGDARALVQANAADPHVQARVKVAETMEAIKQGRARMGLNPLDDDTLFQQALRADFNPKLQDLHQRGIQTKRASRDNLRTMRPTQRKTPARSQNERTLQAVEAMLQQRGRSLGPPSEEAMIDGF